MKQVTLKKVAVLATLCAFTAQADQGSCSGSQDSEAFVAAKKYCQVNYGSPTSSGPTGNPNWDGIACAAGVSIASTGPMTIMQAERKCFDLYVLPQDSSCAEGARAYFRYVQQGSHLVQY